MRYTNDKSSQWRTFADQVSDLIGSEGNNAFFDRVLFFLNDYVHVDNCSVFRISIDKKSGAEHIYTFGELHEDLSKRLASDYVANGFKNDPMVQTALLSPKARVRKFSDLNYSQVYRSQFFESSGLIDKITSLHANRNTLFVVNFYRLENSGYFNDMNFHDLRRLAPIISHSVLRHSKLILGHHALDVTNNYKLEVQLKNRVRSLIDDPTQIFSILSAREKQVAEHSLLGKKEKEIAACIGVGIGTVITYRKRIYTKLNINSKSQLFQLSLMLIS